jgi:hypothetical protein
VSWSIEGQTRRPPEAFAGENQKTGQDAPARPVRLFILRYEKLEKIEPFAKKKRIAFSKRFLNLFSHQ